nr:hypothetical protein [Tanacetum cinerariifolium]
MDWLSNHKAKIICHEKLVTIPLLDGKVLGVFGERPKEKTRLLMSAKASGKKQEEIVVVRYFPEIPLLYRGEYSKWSERFMNYLEEQMDVEAMINFIKNVDQPLPRVTQVSIAGNLSTEQPPLKDKSMWSDQEKKSNTTAKLWDALARQMLGSKYGEQDRKAAVLYEVEQYATMMRQNKNLMDINIDTLYNILKKNQGDVNDAMRLKKKTVMVTYYPLALIAEKIKVSKRKEKVVVYSDSEGSDEDDFSELRKIPALLAHAFNRKKFYSKPTNNNLRTSSTSNLVNKKQEFVKSNDKKVDKKVEEKKRDMSKFKCYNCKKKGHFAKDCKKAKVKDYEYYKIKIDSDQEINANMVFMAQIEKVLSDSEASSSSSDAKIANVSYYTSESESEFEYETSEYYDNSTTYGLFMDNNDDQEIFHAYSKFFSLNLIESQIDHNESDVTHNDSKDVAKLINQMIQEFDKKIAKYQKHLEKANQQCNDFENQNKDLKDKYDVLKNQATTFEKKNNELNEQIKVLIEKNALLLAQTNVLKEQLKVKHQTSSLKPYVPNVILEKIIIDLEDEVVSLLDKEKENLKTIESLKIKGFESSGNANSEPENQNENYCHMVEKVCDNVENPKVIAPGMFKLSVSQSDSPISVSKMSFASNKVETKIKRKRRNRNSSKETDKQVNNDLRGNRDFIHFSDLDTLSSVGRPKPSGVMWKKKGSSNTVKADLSFINHSNLNKNVKRYNCKDLMSCNNAHLKDTQSAHACNNARNAYCNAMMNAYDDVNDLFVFGDVSLRKSHVSKMPFRKKPHASLNMPSKNNSKKCLSRNALKWLPKLKPLAEPVAKWIPRIVHIYLWIIDSGCSKHMTSNCALQTNFVEKFLETVCSGNNDFAMIAGYGDIVIGSMTIKRVYYVKGLDLLTGDRSSNLYTIALNEIALNSSSCLLAMASSSQSWLWHQCLSHLNFATINNLVKKNLVRGLTRMKFEKYHLCSAYEQGKIHQKHHKCKIAFASNQPLYLLHMDLCGPMHVESINGKRYVLFVVDDFSRHRNNLFYTKPCYLLNDYDDVGKLKAKGDIGVFVGYANESAAFRVYNKRTHKINESVNVNFNEISEMASKQISLEPGLSNLNETGKSPNPTVSQVQETSKKDLEDLFQNFYDEYFNASKISKSPTTNVETSNNEGEVFHEVSDSFQEEYSSSSINDDV